MVSADNVTLNSGKYIKLVSPGGGTVHTLKRAAGNTTSPLITVSSGELTLKDVILDGGAVWGGGTPTGISASASLVKVDGTSTKMTLEAGAKIQNNVSSANGGGVYINSGTFILSGGEISGNQGSSNGGGVYINSGEFKLQSGKISSNKTITGGGNPSGGGVYIYGSNATLTMNGGEISGNSNDYSSGGVHINNGTFSLDGGTIYNNNSAYGGGVCMNTGTFNIRGGEIYSNTGSSEAGGLYITNGIFTMSGGKIYNNSTPGKGGGVRCGSGTVVMSGGEIYGNTANSGGGVYYADGSFSMSAAALIKADNAVYIQGGKTINITGALTTPLPDYVAVITPQSYGNGIAVLSGTVSAGENRFGVTPQSGGTSWKVNTSGQLESMGTISASTVYWLGGEIGPYTSATGAILIPAGKTAAVFVVGGGGGGRTRNDGDISRGGGGGEVQNVSAAGPGYYEYQVGQGGAGAIWAVSGEQAGGQSRFGGIIAAGGARGQDLPDLEAAAPSGTACPFASSLSGLTIGTYNLTTASLKYGAFGGIRKGSPATSYNPGDTGGGTANPTGSGTTAGSGTFYGAGGGGTQGAGGGGAGHKGVIFVKIN
jgi:hypothetical protein